MEVEEEILGPSTVIRRVGLINIKSNIKAIRSQIEMNILRATMRFTLLMANVCDSVTRVVGLIPHTPMD